MKTYTIINCEGNILKLEIKKNQNQTELGFRAKMNSCCGCVYFLVTQNQLLDFFNSKITLYQIVQNCREDRFLLTRDKKTYIIKKTTVVLQCRNMLYCEILNDMKMNYLDIISLLLEHSLSMD